MKLRAEFLPPEPKCVSCKTRVVHHVLAKCSSCSVVKRARKARKKRNTRKNRKKAEIGLCSKCGFIPEHRCQLDVDHIDGNKMNNSDSNLQVICANCHRLKTQVNKDFLTQKDRVKV